MPATQSSSLTASSTADKAVDGNTDGVFNHGFMSATRQDDNAWWQVDLGASKEVSFIDIWNRSDVAMELLSDFEVFLSETPFTSTDLDATRQQAGVTRHVVNGEAARPTRVEVNSTTRYVRIQLTQTNYLILSEVQVFGPAVANQAPVANDDVIPTAANAAAAFNSGAFLANDTDVNGDMLSITPTTQPGNGTLTTNPDGTFTYDPNTDFVGTDSFTYEVSDGNGGTDTATVTINVLDATNVAQGRPSQQSSDLIAGSDAAKAVDGNTDGDFTNGSVTATGSDDQAWWEVNLESVRDIAFVDVWNRSDAATDRLADFEVFVSDAPFDSTDLDATRQQASVGRYTISGEAGRPTRIPVNRTGQYVRVQLTDQDYLSLAEVQVFATPPSPAPAPQALGTGDITVDAFDLAASIEQHERRIKRSAQPTAADSLDRIAAQSESTKRGVVQLV